MEFICWIKEKHYAFSSRNFLHHWFLPLNSVTGTVIKIWLAKRNAFRFFFFFFGLWRSPCDEKKVNIDEWFEPKTIFFCQAFSLTQIHQQNGYKLKTKLPHKHSRKKNNLSYETRNLSIDVKSIFNVRHIVQKLIETKTFNK